MVANEGLAPSRFYAPDFEFGVSADFTNRPLSLFGESKWTYNTNSTRRSLVSSEPLRDGYGAYGQTRTDKLGVLSSKGMLFPFT